VYAPTIYEAIVNGLNAIDELAAQTKGGFFGIALDPTEGNAKKEPAKGRFDPDTWLVDPFVSGPMTLTRSTFLKIKEHANAYCGVEYGFDEYNWDWTFVHMQNKHMIPHTILKPSRILAKHIGLEGGMHAHKKPREMPEFSVMDGHFFRGNKISGVLAKNPKVVRKPYGGWGHKRDIEHCLKVLNKT
jgi:hypothetical protein